LPPLAAASVSNDAGQKSPADEIRLGRVWRDGTSPRGFRSPPDGKRSG